MKSIRRARSDRAGSREETGSRLLLRPKQAPAPGRASAGAADRRPSITGLDRCGPWPIRLRSGAAGPLDPMAPVGPVAPRAKPSPRLGMGRPHRGWLTVRLDHRRPERPPDRAGHRRVGSTQNLGRSQRLSSGSTRFSQNRSRRPRRRLDLARRSNGALATDNHPGRDDRPVEDGAAPTREVGSVVVRIFAAGW